MKTRRTVIILFTGIGLVVIAAFLFTDTKTDSPPPPPGTEPTERTFPELPPYPSLAPPTTDLFGNRLEVPAAESGVALRQDPASRPDPKRTDYLSAAPARMQWQQGWGGAALPVSGSDGPACIADGIASGFAHTPQGAALAAADALARALAAPEGIWQQGIRHRFYGTTTQINSLTSRFDRSRRSTPEPARYVVVPDGIRVQAGYQPDFAIVQLASRDRTGYAYASWPMAWVEGDWRIRIPADPETFWGPPTPIIGLSDFGNWKSTS
ncbi:hypothetical protein [Nocardia sp. NPDC052566]|uniref:hypothetical protein n=1 Tax=Nocardia sp. NPDC052566 TaxID=3364330 RepID=UPI0037CB62E5